MMSRRYSYHPNADEDLAPQSLHLSHLKGRIFQMYWPQALLIREKFQLKSWEWLGTINLYDITQYSVEDRTKLIEWLDERGYKYQYDRQPAAVIAAKMGMHG